MVLGNKAGVREKECVSVNTDMRRARWWRLGRKEPVQIILGGLLLQGERVRVGEKRGGGRKI